MSGHETTGIVVNVRRSAYDIYIGRPSKWGNPYIIGRHGSRAEVVAKYLAYILQQQHLLAALGELVGKRLGCYCAPLACHGDVLLELTMRKEMYHGATD